MAKKKTEPKTAEEVMPPQKYRGGRKKLPPGEQKEMLYVFVRKIDIAALGGMDEAKLKVQDFIEKSAAKAAKK